MGVAVAVKETTWTFIRNSVFNFPFTSNRGLFKKQLVNGHR